MSPLTQGLNYRSACDSRRQPLTWDVTVVSTLAESYVHLSSQSTGGAAEAANLDVFVLPKFRGRAFQKLYPN